MTVTRRLVLLVLVVAALTLQSSSPVQARSQNASPEGARLNLAPAIVAGIGASLDTFSTMRFLSNGSGCVEATSTFTRPPHSPSRPDVRRMWTYNAIGVASIVTLTVAAHQIERRHPGSRMARIVGLFAKGAGYGTGARRGFAAGRNIARCGW